MAKRSATFWLQLETEYVNGEGDPRRWPTAEELAARHHVTVRAIRYHIHAGSWGDKRKAAVEQEPWRKSAAELEEMVNQLEKLDSNSLGAARIMQSWLFRIMNAAEQKYAAGEAHGMTPDVLTRLVVVLEKSHKVGRLSLDRPTQISEAKSQVEARIQTTAVPATPEDRDRAEKLRLLRLPTHEFEAAFTRLKEKAA